MVRPLPAALLATLVLVGCVQDDGFVCATDQSCGSSGRCEASGYCSVPDSMCGRRYARSAGAGRAGACVGPDGAVADAATDAAEPDAATDSGPSGPVQNGQAADLVLGQPSFESGAANAGGLGAASLKFPQGITIANGRLLVADEGNSRVLQWNTLPTVSHAPADVVYGQASMTAVAVPSAPVMRDRLTGPQGLAFDGTRLWVADVPSNRVLGWAGLQTLSATSPEVVLGQADFMSRVGGAGAAQLIFPNHVASDGQRLVISDNGNNRVLVFDSLPTASTVAASHVLGQADFGQNSAVTPPTAGSLGAPYGVAFDGPRLLVVDSLNNRVLVWNRVPTQNGAPADFAIGQRDLTSGARNAGAGPSGQGLFDPRAVVVAGGSLFVSDAGNHRVLVFTPVPTHSGESARAVLGQDDLTTDTLAAAPQANRIYRGEALAVSGQWLFVVDYSWHRVLRFTLSP